MTALIYFLVLLVSVLGLGAGVTLAFLAREELESIRKYLVLAKKLLLGGLLGLIGYIYSGSIGTGILFSALGFGLGWFILYEDWKGYLIFGGVFFACSFSETLFPLSAGLIFMYGLIAGTLLVQRHLKELKKDRMAVAKKAIAAGLAYFIFAGMLSYLKYLPKP